MRRRPAAAAELRGVWHELRDGPAILAGLDLRIEPGERVALMGRNGAGQEHACSRHLQGADAADARPRGQRRRRRAADAVSRATTSCTTAIADEASAAAIARAGPRRPRARAPARHLGRRAPASRARARARHRRPLRWPASTSPRAAWTRRASCCSPSACAGWRATACAVLVATHDTEFAAEVADRVVLMGQGDVIADGPASEVLCGGWHFATEVARVLGGARRRADTGAGRRRARAGAGAMSWQLASFALLVVRARGRLRLVRALASRRRKVLALVAALAALATVGRIAFAPIPNVKPTTDIALFAGYALGPAPGFAVGADRGARLERLLRPGPVDAVADARLGPRRRDRRRARPRSPGATSGAVALAAACALAGLVFGALTRPLPVDAQGRPRTTSPPTSHGRQRPCPTTSLTSWETSPSACARPDVRARAHALPPPLRGALGAGRPAAASLALAFVRRRSRPLRRRRRARAARAAAYLEARAERRRRLRRLARAGVEPAPHRLGRRSASRRRGEPARRRARRQDADRLRAGANSRRS